MALGITGDVVFHGVCVKQNYSVLLLYSGTHARHVCILCDGSDTKRTANLFVVYIVFLFVFDYLMLNSLEM